MPQTRGRVFDDFARLMTDAAGLAEGVRREAETLVRTNLERFLATADVPTREELEAVQEMARLAREENAALRDRIAALEQRLALGGAADPTV